MCCTVQYNQGMSELKLFKITGTKVDEIPGEAGGLEKSLQTLMEQNLQALLRIRLLASEHSTGKVHGGRIDSLGIDENDCPVIIEYKRALSENVINQGLYYLDWLLDHRAEFKLLVLERFGKAAADKVDWSAPRLVCVAANYTKHDEHAVRQINRNIELIRYRRFGPHFLALELLTSTNAEVTEDESPRTTKSSARTKDKPISQALAEMSPSVRDLWEELRAHTLGLGSDVTEKHLKLYVAFRRLRNFATAYAQKGGIALYLHLDPSSITLERGFTRDVSKVGHWGTGDLEVWIDDKASLRRALSLVTQAYDRT